MSIQSINQQVQDNEQYKIRSQKSEQVQSTQSTQSSQTQPVKTDTYDKSNPVGETVEGIYSVSHDSEGNMKVNYTQPKTSGVQATSTSSASSDDDELEALKKQEEQLKAQLNRETDESARRALMTQLQSIEMQIAMKSSGVNA